MASKKQGFFDRWALNRAHRKLVKAAQNAGGMRLSELRNQRAQARKLKQQIDKLLFVADSRLALPMIGNQSFPRPSDADWAWRPELWCGPLPVAGVSPAESNSKLSDEVTLFHDCAKSELTLRQLRNTREADLAPYGLRMDVFQFDGSYLSLAIDLPEEACRGLKRKHLVRLTTILELEKPLDIFARLNIQHGPNTEQIVRELPVSEHDMMIEFDLAYSELNEKRIEKMWVDLIFESPQMNQVILRDLTFCRRRRAEL